ncbi:hypothetical protein E3N88_38215 [Mikania micrantha]|uniref:Uncharacterized protein n=1 Tax=Mikania micrantha TaxID=192012 RepID=A0A5N6LTC7_9ASTR|nr:hypothetical protein E3N88_38215 [Mikania micrantha]
METLCLRDRRKKEDEIVPCLEFIAPALHLLQLSLHQHNVDAVGLYIDAYDDYKVLHIKRRFGVFDVNVYSRRFEFWRNIPFFTRSKYASPSFSVSSGTFCVDTLYISQFRNAGSEVKMC